MPTPCNFRLDIAYDGTNFWGYQSQSNQPGSRTVSGVLSDYIHQLVNEPVALQAASRTDRGVHATQQVINFSLKSPMSLSAIKRRLLRPHFSDLFIRSVALVPHQFHAQYAARFRVYRYYFCDVPPKMHHRRYIAQLPYFGNAIYSIRNIASLLTGCHNFQAFCRSGSVQPGVIKNYHRHIQSVRLVDCDYYYYFEIQATGFLYGMVRNLLGSLFEVVYARRSIYDFFCLFTNNPDMRYNYKPVPAHGLSLFRIAY